MAKATAELGEQVDAAGPSQSPDGHPLNFDRLLERGAMLYGVAVRHVRIDLVDGRSLRLDLRTEGEPEDMTEMQAAVVTVVDRIPTGHVRTTLEIARAAGFADSGSLRDFVKSLASAGRLRRVHRGWQKV